MSLKTFAQIAESSIPKAGTNVKRSLGSTCAVNTAALIESRIESSDSVDPDAPEGVDECATVADLWTG